MSNEIITPAVEESTQAAAQTITPNQNDTINNNSVSPANEAAGNNADASNGDQASSSTQDGNQTDNTNMSVTPALDVPANSQEVTDPTPSDQEVSGGSVTPAVSSINPEVVALLVSMLTKATSSAFYMSNDKRVAVLKEALNIPVSDDKSFQQFFNHAEKDLVTASYQNARKNGGTPVEVTTAMVMAAAHEKYLAKHGKRAIVNEEYAV